MIASSRTCKSANGAPNAKADTLPAEPGGHANFQALYGHKYAVPAINSPMDPAVRGLEHTVSTLTYPDPYKPMTDQLMVALADQAEIKLLHMTSTDPQRTPAFTLFSYRNTYDSDSTSSATQTPCTGAACVVLNASFAYIHGGIADRVSDTWVGLAGPGVLHKGQDAATWSDHADFRPTILALTGLSSAYVHDGRVLVEDLDPGVLPPSVAANQASFVALAAAYKQLNAPFGKVSEASLQYATPNIASTDDAVYQAYLAQLGSYTAQRDALAAQIKTFLDNVSFHGQVLDPATAGSLTRQANTLIKTMVGYAHP